MPFEYRDHQADVILVAWGATPAEAFESGAKGLLELMVNTSSIEPATAVEIACDADDLPLLFVAFLNEILFQRDQTGLFFREVKVSQLEAHESGYHLHSTAWGEPVDPHKHQVREETKAATYGQLGYVLEGGQHRFQCIVDV